MAYDLIFGKTSRDWSCGLFLGLPSERKQLELDVAAIADVEKLGKQVRAEISQNFNAILKLEAANRMPPAERKAYGGFLKKWMAFSEGRKFKGEDVVALRNFREANKRFTERLAVFEKVAKTPLKEPVAVLPEKNGSMIPFRPPGSEVPASPMPWGVIVGVGAALGCVGFLYGKKH